jgi:uncharacterized membrane protein YidH (DUF202 family)
MRAFLEVVRLELKALSRSKTVLFLLVASVAWMLAFPHLVRGDGTVAGARELDVHFSLGGVFALLVVSLLASATGSLARERAEKRLQLTLVRPVARLALVLGKALAHVLVGAFVLAVSCGVLAARTDLSRPCSHVLSPVLPPVRESAERMYALYMASTNTPARIRHAPKAAVMRLLENKENDRYVTIPTNGVARWRFAAPGDAVRIRFTNAFEMRQDVRGALRSGAASLAVSNQTQAVVLIPFRGEAPELAFENRGAHALMLRPRRDVNVLVTADSFAWNLARAFAALVAILSLVVSAGLLLGAGLGRPVALFVAFVTLAVSEMSPSVVEQYPDELDPDARDRVGLVITRFAASVTRPVSAASPLESLAKDECVEPSRVRALCLANVVALPLLLSLLAAFVLPRKQDDLV